jgi:hypothetical protein
MRYKRVMITKRYLVKTPAVKVEIASDREIFYLKTVNPINNDETFAITEQQFRHLIGYIREDHPWFNYDLIRDNFKMTSHALMTTHFLIQILGRDRVRNYIE